MPTLKKYSGIKACEDYCQRIAVVSNGNVVDGRTFYDTSGNPWNRYPQSASSTNASKIASFMQYLSASTVKASADDYDTSDYNGTSTGSCTFNLARSTSNLSYIVTFTANENTTIKCLKFFKTLMTFDGGGSSQNAFTLMYAIYFDEPISVVSGQSYVFNIVFNYDDVQVSII